MMLHYNMRKVTMWAFFKIQMRFLSCLLIQIYVCLSEYSPYLQHIDYKCDLIKLICYVLYCTYTLFLLYD